jgi:hypothetical protein
MVSYVTFQDEEAGDPKTGLKNNKYGNILPHRLYITILPAVQGVHTV